MPIVMPEEQSYELAPPESHTAVCFRVVDFGTQAGMYGPKLQILFSWELPDELMRTGRPFEISRRYTLSSNRKSALRADIEGWLGRTLKPADFGQFDLSQLLGTTCLIGAPTGRSPSLSPIGRSARTSSNSCRSGCATSLRPRIRDGDKATGAGERRSKSG